MNQIKSRNLVNIFKAEKIIFKNINSRSVGYQKQIYWYPILIMFSGIWTVDYIVTQEI